MASFWIKMVTVPVALALAAWLLPNVRYDAYYMPILVGAILAVVGMLMEYTLLRDGMLWVSTFADVAVAALIIYFVSNMFAGADVSFFGAVLASLLIGVLEFFTHRWLIRTGRAEKLA